ncbi:MAG: murein transglycosylase A [Alphaproteobacteria bacterium]|nr:murein transglycosylase A [Alphaproteobacteria bacterium]
MPRNRLVWPLLLLLVLLVQGCAPPAPPPDRLVLKPARFADLQGWREDRIAEALPALARSCQAIARQAGRDLGLLGRAEEWAGPCARMQAIAPGDDAALRALLEAEFVPVAAANNDQTEGLFTGYYEASLRGSRRKAPGFEVPLLGRPSDLVMVDLGLFRDQLRGQRIAGRVNEGQLRPYETRAEIETGALASKAPVIAWVSDPVDAFFLHIQGSGRVELAEGGVLRVGYAAQNGHPYFAIGRRLIERGALTPETVSMQTIRAWLADNPGEAAALMRENPSFVFFRELSGEGPIGAQNVALTAGRSLAVDRAHFPLGFPLWLDTAHPAADPAAPDRPLRRLMVAQDTGGAIRGPVRGDVFWGHGPEAAAIAGRMKHKGRYWLLLPRPVAARIAAGV